MKKPLLFVLIAASLRAVSYAQEPPATEICDPVELISAEKFDREESLSTKPGSRGWHAGIGAWKIANGAVEAVQEMPGAKYPKGHQAFCEHVVDLQDLVLTAEFRLGDAPAVLFGCREFPSPETEGKFHHVGYLEIRADAMWISQNGGIGPTTQRQELARLPLNLEKEAWHHVTVEVCQGKWLARLDGKTVMQASHPRFLARKGRISLCARGEGAQFRDVRLWKAAPRSAVLSR